jgi:murein DD-endopeptidase MepM/ murein hydrolase activator NlpD
MKIKHLIIGIITSALIFGHLTGFAFATRVDEAEKEKTALENRKTKMEDSIAQLEKEKGDIATYIIKLDKQLGELSKEISRLNNEIASTEEILEITKEELKEAKEVEDNQYVTMKKRIKYMYEKGSKEYIEVLLSATDIADLLNRTEYIEKISEYDKGILQRYQVVKQEVADKEEELETTLAELNTLNEEIVFEQETVTKLAKDKTAEMKKYDENILDSNNQLMEYEQQIEQQESLIENILAEERRKIEAEEKKKREEAQAKKFAEAKAQNNKTGSAASVGNSTGSTTESSAGNTTGNSTGYTWPVPSSGRITSYFGWRVSPTAGASSNHKGIDIGAPSGTPIVAASGGNVVIAKYSNSAGNYIMIYHGNNTYTVYMHCSALNVSVGANVNKGSVIGYVGTTGYSTGPHLHFGISINGSYVNPLNYVSY